MWSVVTRKELKDALRDRRALAALLLFPLIRAGDDLFHVQYDYRHCRRRG